MTTRTPLTAVTDTPILPADEKARLQHEARRLAAQHPDVLPTVAAPANFENAVTRMVSEQPTLTDISAVLHVLGGNVVGFEVDRMRTQALCHLAARALGKFDSWTRTCPPDVLRDVVAEALHVCRAPLCDNDVADWQDDYDGCCGPQCLTDYQRATGDV